MANTSSLGPLSNTSVAGKTNWSQPIRVHRDQTSSSAAFATTANVATLWYNCFDSGQIPAGATIDGIELVSTTIATGTGRIGTAGSTGPTETATLSIRLYNGSSYSSSLYSNTFTGANDYYPDPSGSGQVLVGGPTNLVGLTWDPADQADFGFRIDIDSITLTPVMVALRGLALKVYYTEGGTSPTPTPSQTITPTITPSITPTPTPSGEVTYLLDSINDVVPNTINKIGSIFLSGASKIIGQSILPSLFSSNTFSFEDQTVVETTGAEWSPSLTHSDWTNGSSAVDGTYWGLTSNKTVFGWQLAQDTTPSNYTGPQGGATEPSGTPTQAVGFDKYMYTEATSSQNLFCFVARTPGYNFTTEMGSTSNDLTLEFWVNAYGDQMADLYVYIDDAATSNHTNATLIDYFTASHSGTQEDGTTTLTQNSNSATYDFVTYAGAVWSKITLSLNSYRTIDADQYIYFVAQNGTGYKADIGIDLVKIYES